MEALQMIQQEDPEDQEEMEEFMKVWLFFFSILIRFTSILEQMVTAHREA
jgi:hypothetical protein